MGLGMGWAASHLLRLMSRRDADILIRNDDLVGKEGMVTLRLMQEERDLVQPIEVEEVNLIGEREGQTNLSIATSLK